MEHQTPEPPTPRMEESLPPAGTAYPRDLAHFIWEWATRNQCLQLCETEQLLYHFISQAFQASLRTEEGPLVANGQFLAVGV